MRRDVFARFAREHVGLGACFSCASGSDLFGTSDRGGGLGGLTLFAFSALGGVCGLDGVSDGLLGRGDFRRCGDVRCLAPATYGLATGRLGRRGGRRFRPGGGSGTAATACWCGGRGLLLCALPLLTLPARADTRHLVIRQRAQMAAHGNVHLTK